jgi:hypothetical protein
LSLVEVREMRYLPAQSRSNDSPHPDADASPRSRHPTQVIEASTELGDEVRGLSNP